MKIDNSCVWRGTSRALWLLLIVVCSASPGAAEWPYDEVEPRGGGTAVQLGPRAGYDYDGDTYSAGAQLRVPIWRRSRFTLTPSADLYNDGTRTDWQANLDLLMAPGPRGGIYAGLGFAWVEAATGRERAINQVIGLQIPLGRGPLRSYVEARWTELDRKTVFRLVVGVNVALLRY